MIRFTAPLALLLLLSLPIFAWAGWPAVRGSARKREVLALRLRLAIALCLVFALAGLELPNFALSDRLSVIFLLDISDSMPLATRQEAENYIRQELEKMGPKDQAGLVVFGGEALVDRPLSSSRELQTITSIPNTTHTNLGEAIELALALFPTDTARRLVILSDGANTTGDPRLAARLAGASGVDVRAVYFDVQPSSDARISQVSAPQWMRVGDSFDLAVTLETTRAGPAELRVFAAGTLIYSGQVTLSGRQQTFLLQLKAQETGFISYQVHLVTGEDHFYQNNTLAAFSFVSGPPKILIVVPPAGEAFGWGSDLRPEEAAALGEALKTGAYSVDTVSPARLTSDLTQLADYSAVVLVDVPARQLNQRQMSALTSYVRDIGGGLITVGGPTSYGPGGYYRTTLEQALPVEMMIKDEQRRADLAMVFIIDHSGSMSDTSGGVTKLELAKEAAIRSVEMLFASDRVGVIIFDDSASWVVPLTDLSDPSQVTYAISTVRSGGGTDILAGLQAMAQALPDDPAAVKHVVLLTDGGADPTGIPALVQQLYEEQGITLTTVGVGKDAAPFLPELARLGGGRYHFAADPASIPSIFTEETTFVTRAYLIEESFVPRLVSTSPILDGIESMPVLYGYVGTSYKPRAQTILQTHQGDPLLAAWQYGLGRVVSFTSDASGRWAKDWLGWDGFPTFWIQAVSYAAGNPQPSWLETTILPSAVDASQMQIHVTALNPSVGEDSASPFLNGYSMFANLVAPDGSVQEIVLNQTGPGQYTATFTPESVGAYLLRLTGQPPPGSSAPAIAETTGWVQSYSAEYSASPGVAVLHRLVNTAHGRTISTEPFEPFAHDLPTPGVSIPTWTFLLGLAACLLPLDIAVRRLVMDRADFLKAWRAVQRRLRKAPATPGDADSARRQQTETLLQVKQRATGELGRPQAARPPTQPPLETPPVTIEPLPPPPEKPSHPPPESGKTTASALLASKRKNKQ